MKEIMRKSAELHGVSQEELENEIFSALIGAMRNKNESNVELWDTVAPYGEDTPLFDMICALASLVADNNKAK